MMCYHLDYELDEPDVVYRVNRCLHLLRMLLLHLIHHRRLNYYLRPIYLAWLMWQPSMDVQNICVNEEGKEKKKQQQINKQLSEIIFCHEKIAIIVFDFYFMYYVRCTLYMYTCACPFHFISNFNA